MATVLWKSTRNAVDRFRTVVRGHGRFLSADTSATDESEKRLEAEKMGRKFRLSDGQLQDVACRMTVAMNAGLQSANRFSSVQATVKCWDTRVRFPPPAPEARLSVGRYLSLELTHGHYFRTRLTHVSDTNDLFRDSETHPLPEYVKTGTVRGLFDYLSYRLAAFAGRHNVRATGLPLAFTFGFPVRQSALDKAVLHRWAKEFDCKDAAGRDVVAELRSSMQRARVAVGPVVLFNDACALMLSNRYDEPDRCARISVVVNNGCNCCYAAPCVRNVHNRQKRPLRSVSKNGTSCAIVNTEWGGLGDDGTLVGISTEFDKSVDERSLCPGKQIFEKMTSGLYMGELVRKFVLEMTKRKLMFDGRLTSPMLTAWTINPLHLCAVESDVGKSYEAGRAVLNRVLGVTDPSDFDCELFRYACERVTERSAHLVSAGLTSVLRQLAPFPTQNTITPVIAGGFVFDKHTKYGTAVKCKTLVLADKAISLQTGDYRRGALLVAEILGKISSKSSTET